MSNTLKFNSDKYTRVMNNLKQNNKSILDYYTNKHMYENSNPDSKTNFIHHNNTIYNKKKDISIENEIKGINRINSHCTNEKYNPITDKYFQ